MVGYEVEILGLNEQLKKLHGFDVIADRHLLGAMARSVLVIQANVKPLTPVFRGRLRNNIESKTERESVGSIVGRVFSTVDEVYPAVMEFGRRPGARMPPPSALERWVHLVLGVPTAEARGVAYTVARGIARKGIKGRRFMQRGFEKSKGVIAGFFQAALDAVANELSVRG